MGWSLICWWSLTKEEGQISLTYIYKVMPSNQHLFRVWAYVRCCAYVGLHGAIHLGVLVELILAYCKNLTQPQCTQFVGSNSGCANGRGSLLPRLPTLTHTINLDSPNPRRCGTASWQLKWSLFFFVFLVNLGMPSSLETHGAAGKRHCLWVPLFWWAIGPFQPSKLAKMMPFWPCLDPMIHEQQYTIHKTISL